MNVCSIDLFTLFIDVHVCDDTVMLCFFLLAFLSSVCFSFIVYIVSCVDIGGQH